MSAKEEVKEFGIDITYDILKNSENKNGLDNGMFLICEYIMYLVKKDPEKGDPNIKDNEWKELNNKIKQAGESLYEYGGEQIMCNVLLSLPKRYRREIEYKWHGIGKFEA